MKKRFKGFTLIECLIALAILGVASLTMAQIYAGVARRNRNNQLVNTSLSNQMAYVERYTSSEAVTIYYGSTTNTPDDEAKKSSTTKKPPHAQSVSTNHNYVKIVKVKDGKDPLNDTLNTGDYVSDSTYSFPVDVYVLLSRDQNDVNSDNKKSDGTAATFDAQYKDYLVDDSGNDKNLNLRYRYITGHAN